MRRRIGQLLGIIALLGFVWLNVDYRRDPPYWRRWWDTMTHLQPDYLNLSPTVAMESSQVVPLPAAEVGKLTIAPAALRAAEKYAAEFDSFSLVVVHHEKVQHAWYRDGWNRDRLSQSQSMNKTITAIMVGIAIDEGYIGSTDDRIGEYLEEWADDPRGDITIEQLLVMSSGLAQYEFTLNPFATDSAFRFLFSRDRAAVVLDTPLVWEPGWRFDYNDVNAQLAGMVVERAVGRPYAAFVEEQLWEPLGGQHAELWLDREDGLAMTACCMLAAANDWAKIGIMLKNGGRANGRQVVSEDWVERMITPSHQYAGYGYFTWLAAGVGNRATAADEPEFHQDEPFAADDVFMLSGFGGQRVYISRSLDLVIVRNGPFSGMQPLKPGWDNAWLFNTIANAIQT